MHKLLRFGDRLLDKVAPMDEVQAGCAPREYQQYCYCYDHIKMYRTVYVNADCTTTKSGCSGSPANYC